VKTHRHTPEQVVRKLREGDRLLNEGKDRTEVLRTLEISEDTLLRNELVLVDELGFAPLDDTGAQLLFRFVAAAYERRAVGIGSHWPFESWGRFLPEHTTAVSLLDRLLHHCHVELATSGDQELAVDSWSGTPGGAPADITPPIDLSGRQDLNLRPLDPQSSALPSCATSRPGGAACTSTTEAVVTLPQPGRQYPAWRTRGAPWSERFARTADVVHWARSAKPRAYCPHQVPAAGSPRSHGPSERPGCFTHK
jgi:hypothetical protein